MHRGQPFPAAVAFFFCSFNLSIRYEEPPLSIPNLQINRATTLTNRLSSFLLAISAAFSSLVIPAMLIGCAGSAVFGRDGGDNIGVDLALEAGENAGV